MAYIDKNGKTKYTLQEKIAYHNECANTGKGADGQILTFAQRAHHASASARSARKLNRFKKQEEFNVSIKKPSSRKGK